MVKIFGAKEKTYVDGKVAGNARKDYAFGVLEVELDEFGFTRDYLIHKKHFTIGRSPDCDIVLEDNRASRLHAHIHALGESDHGVVSGRDPHDRGSADDWAGFRGTFDKDESKQPSFTEPSERSGSVEPTEPGAATPWMRYLLPLGALLIESDIMIRQRPVAGGSHTIKLVCTAREGKEKTFRFKVDGKDVNLGCWDFATMAACVQ